MQVFFDHREELAPAIWESYFRCAQPLDYVAGQYVDLRLPNVAEPSQPRTFTLTSLPNDPLISFVSKHPIPGSDYKRSLLGLKPGDSAAISDAMGDLVLPKLASVPLVFVAGGIGVASFAAMLKTLLRAGEQRDVSLLYALRDSHETIFQDEIAAYQFTHYQQVIAPIRLTAEQIMQLTSSQSLVYLSGSQSFVDGLRRDLQMMGLGHERLIFDYFSGYSEL